MLIESGRTLFVTAFFSDDKDRAYPEYCKSTRSSFLRAVETHLSTHELSKSGSYIIGNKITYADLVLYQILHDESLTKDGAKELKDHPRLAKLADAVESRPKIKAFLHSDRYLG